MPKRKVESGSDLDDSFIAYSSDEEPKSKPSKKLSLKKETDFLVDSDYCSKSSFASSLMKSDAIKTDREGVDIIEPIHEQSDEEQGSDEESSESSMSEKDTSDAASAEEESNESQEEWTSGKSTKNAFKKSVKKRKQASSRVKKTQSLRKDVWVDDESGNNSLSSVDIDSGDEVVEKKLNSNENEVLDIYNTATYQEFKNFCFFSQTKWEKLVSLRPFTDYTDLTDKLVSAKASHSLTPVIEMLNAGKIVDDLLIKCKRISKTVKRKVDHLTEAAGDVSSDEENESVKKFKLKPQPKVLNTKLKLKQYQVVGLNWLMLMHKEGLNSILADEMGLGKTCQSITFLAHLYELNPASLNLIVVPSSTLENWAREIRQWFPKFLFVIYRGHPETRREIRDDIQSLIKKKKINAILTTYNLVGSNDKDKAFFRSLKLEYCVYDEAHMLKNMKTLKYQDLIRIGSKHRLLLTGTPLQNNIVELMSLLYFVTPDIFQKSTRIVNKMFLPKQHVKNTDLDKFYSEKTKQAREIMDPFVLRRLKSDVLKELPEKKENIIQCKMTAKHSEVYANLLKYYKERRAKLFKLEEDETATENEKRAYSDKIFAVISHMRQAANHPLLRRTLYTDEKLKEMATLIMKESDANTRYDFVVEDMTIMNDFELHKLCPLYEGLKGYELSDETILDSGKFVQLDIYLEQIKAKGDRTLIFSQFKIMLDIIEDYCRIRNHRFLRLDGSTKVETRQGLIDEYNNDKDIFIFMLTTKAGGVGINLIGANNVIIHDLDYNPQNDRQAEDRCHRVGQKKEVSTYKLISTDTVDETIINMQYQKLQLDAEISNNADSKAKLEVMKFFKNMLNER